jgi:sugar lactone lactonase YvrE
MRAGFFVAGLFALPLRAAEQPVLGVETKIALTDVKGRIDHLAFDVAHQRLFIAELANGSVDVVDLGARRVAHRIRDLEEPQGLAYSEVLKTLYVACGGDGTLRAWRTDDYSPAGSVKLGEDADNVRIDDAAKRVYVGYGNGALAVLEAATLRPVTSIPLKAHPESFQLSPLDDRVFINVPNAHEIAVISRSQARQVASWPTQSLHANYPMALDTADQQVLTVFRQPARLAAWSMAQGGNTRAVETCGDADDVFLDARRQRLYVICGQGYVDVFNRGDLAQLGRIPTAPGARTGLFAPSADRLFVAARAQDGADATLWIMKPLD